MCTGFSLPKLKLGSSTDNLNLMLQIVIEHFAQIQNFRLFIHDGQHIDPESRLHRCMLVQIVKHNVWIHVAA
ncbi:hypothetical protein D1872_294440 [compost metagenome]